MLLLLATPALAGGWAIEVPTTFDFATAEAGRGDLHLDRLALAAGMEVQWEDEFDVCDPKGTWFSPGFLQGAVDVFADLQASDLDLYLDAGSRAPWTEDATDLWGDPAVTWGGGGPTMRVVLLDSPPMMADFSGVFQTGPLGASAALWVWNGSAWGFASNLNPGEVADYAILPMSPGTYGAIRNAVPDLTKCPAAETVAHEIGHALGFTEQRYRTDAWDSVLEGPTALPTLWRGVSPFETDPDRTLRLGAYAQSLLWHEFWAPSSGLDDWVMQSAVLRKDPTQPDSRAVPKSMFQNDEINPQHLVLSNGTFVDCATRGEPVYFAQYSEVSYVSVGCPATADLEYVLEGTQVLATHSETNQCGWADMWEYQHDEALTLTEADLTAAGVADLPSVTGLPVDIELTMRINAAHAATEWDPDDNETTMTVTLHPASTVDPMCAPQKHVAVTPVVDGKYGKVLAATQTAITSSMWTATGAPARPDGGNASVGEVRVQKWDDQGVAIAEQVLASPTTLGGERHGFSLSIHGSWLVVGAPGTNGFDGQTHLYRRSGNTYALHTTLNPAGGAGQAGRFGWSVAVRQLNVNGVETSVLFVGEPMWDDMGRVSVYTIDQTNPPVRMGGLVEWELDAEFGSSLAVSNDTLLIGAPNQDGPVADTGEVFVYDLDPAGTTLIGVADPAGTLAPTDRRAGDRFGASVAIDGDIAIVGAPKVDYVTWFLPTVTDAGAAFVYGRAIDSGGPFEIDQYLHLEFAPGGREVGDAYGTSVAVFRGNLLVGAPARDLNVNGTNPVTDAGAAFLYSPHRSEDYSIRRTFVGLGGGDRAADNRFGQGVALGDRLYFVGAPRADTDGTGTWIGNDVGGVRAGPYRTFDWVR